MSLAETLLASGGGVALVGAGILLLLYRHRGAKLDQAEKDLAAAKKAHKEALADAHAELAKSDARRADEVRRRDAALTDTRAELRAMEQDLATCHDPVAVRARLRRLWARATVLDDPDDGGATRRLPLPAPADAPYRG